MLASLRVPIFSLGIYTLLFLRVPRVLCFIPRIFFYVHHFSLKLRKYKNYRCNSGKFSLRGLSRGEHFF